jgi:PIN domain
VATAKHHLFLDANIYLRFYKLADSDVKELDRLVMLVKSGEVKLYLTEQARDEFRRNRDGVIAESLDWIKKQRLNPSFPRMFVNHAEFDDLDKTIQSYEGQRKKMLEEITDAAVKGELAADELIEELFGLAEFIPLTDPIWEKARQRYDLRNPPGKGKSYGDAVHWVSLMHALPDGTDILIVTDDGDFKSKLDPEKVSDFLGKEWAEKKGATATVYSSLPEMFREHYKDIKLLAALEKDLAQRSNAVKALVNSGKFAETHAAVEALAGFAEFLPSEAEAMMRAAVTNTQIERILEDDDVFEFFTKLAHQYSEVIDPGTRAAFWAVFESADERSDEAES